MPESLLFLNKSQQEKIYEKIEKGLSLSHFEIFPLERRVLENKALGLTKPTKNRQLETAQCVGWRKYFAEGYFIEVLPTFNESRGEFSSEGQASVLIKFPKKKSSKSLGGFEKSFALYFNRVSGLEERLLAIVSYLDHLMKNRPFGKDGRLMLIKKSREIYYNWKSCDGQEIIPIFEDKFQPNFSEERMKLVVEIFKDREYYHNNKPEDSGSIKDIKKTRVAKTGEKVVPIH